MNANLEKCTIINNYFLFSLEELKSINSNSNKLSLFGPIKDNYSIKKSQTQKIKLLFKNQKQMIQILK